MLVLSPLCAEAAPAFGEWGVDLTGMDRSTSPGANLHRFVNGAWLDRTVIPPDRSRAGPVFDLEEDALASVRAILESRDPRDPPVAADDLQKARAFYAALVGQRGPPAPGLSPIRPSLDAISKADSLPALVAVMATGPRRLGANLFDLRIESDDRRPDAYCVRIGQSGAGLPDRSYYLDPRLADKATAYEAYAAQLLTLAGWRDPAASAAAVMAFERRLAEVSWDRGRLRAPDALYNPMSVGDLEAAAPSFPWRAYFAAAGLAHVDRFVVGPKSAVVGSAEVLAATPLATLKAWLTFRRLDAVAQALPEPFAQAQFAFRQGVMLGETQRAPPWRQAVEITNQAMGDAIGQAYVARHFPPTSKAAVELMVDDLRSAMRRRIETSDWMSESTRQEALRKLARLTVKVGYTESWKSYRHLRVDVRDPIGNLDRAARLEWRGRVDLLGRPVDRSAWEMTPQTVNAYAMARQNEIVFPAALMQPPLFDPDADPAVNFGAIGFIIGHEIIHGFDDRGRKYDADGVLRDWWSAEDAARFNARAVQLGKQYAAMPSGGSIKINPLMTMGENIADVGGLALALDAWRWRNAQTSPASPPLDGFTADQRVLLGWSQIWRMKLSPQASQQRLLSDSHAPPYARGTGPAINLDAFYDLFGVRPGDPLYVPAEDRVRIW